MRRIPFVAAFLAVACLVPPAAPSHAALATAKRPILFVHGYNSSASAWDTMVANFKAAGYVDAELRRWSYDYRLSNKTTAEDIRTRVDTIRAETGWDKVDVVTHSMGGLSSRYYLKNLGGSAKVDDWVSLGGPNHGTNTANYCGATSCVEMREGSSFLTALNSDDESPGAVSYATWWSPCDSVINPDSSVAVAGATNTNTACLSHSQLRTDANVFTQVRDTVAG